MQLAWGPEDEAFRADVRIRHRAVPVPATVRPGSGDDRQRRWLIETDSPVWAAAPGQAAVLYDGEVVVGGGRIARPPTRSTRASVEIATTARGELVGSGV